MNTAVNHCLLEVEVLEAPQVRYTQDNQTPVAEMAVQFDGLRPDDPPGQLKVVGWGSLAQDLQNRVQVGQRLMVEGRLRMNTVTRQDGVKEKRAEFTLSRLHPIGAGASGPVSGSPMPARASVPAPTRSAAPRSAQAAAPAPAPASAPPAWNASPLVPDLPEGEDEIPF
jgi:single-stranded DNA-binding protein